MARTKKKALSIDDIALPNFPPQDYQVSKHSVYRDGTWNLSDGTDARLKGYTEAKLSIDWHLYRFSRSEHGTALNNVIAKSHLDARVSNGIIEDIRLMSFLQLEMPSVFGRRGRKIERSKPPTVVAMVRALVVLFSVVDTVRAERIASMAPGILYTPVKSVFEITFQDLESAIKK